MSAIIGGHGLTILVSFPLTVYFKELYKSLKRFLEKQQLANEFLRVQMIAEALKLRWSFYKQHVAKEFLKAQMVRCTVPFTCQTRNGGVREKGLPEKHIRQWNEPNWGRTSARSHVLIVDRGFGLKDLIQTLKTI